MIYRLQWLWMKRFYIQSDPLPHIKAFFLPSQICQYMPLPSSWWLLPGGVQPLWAGGEATGVWEALWASSWPLQRALRHVIQLLSWPTPTGETPFPTWKPLWGSRQQAPGGWSPTSPTTSFSPPGTLQTTAWRNQVRRSEVQFNLILRIHCLFQCHFIQVLFSSLQQVDKVSRETPPSPLHLPTPPKKAAPSVEKPIQKSLDSHTHPHGPRTYSRTYKKVLSKSLMQLIMGNKKSSCLWVCYYFRHIVH